MQIHRLLGMLAAASIAPAVLAQPFAYVNRLKGPANAVPEGNLAWNVHEWEWIA